MFITAVSLGQTDLDPKRPYLNAPVVVDNQELGTIWLYPEFKGKKLLLELIPMLRYLSPYLENKKGIDSLKKNSKKRFISTEALESLGVITFFDEEELLVRVTIRPHIRSESNIDISAPIRSITIIPEQNAAASGFANFYLNQPFSNIGEERDSVERDPFLGAVDTTLNILGVAAISGVEYNEGSDIRYQRKNSWLEYDFDKIKSRFSIGEIEYSATGFLVEGTGLGAAISNVVSLNPQTLSRGTGSYSVTLEKSSIVEVQINGSTVHRGRYPAGPLDLSNFPFVSGNNSVEVKITDDHGRVEIVSYSRLFDNELLAPDIFEYSISHAAPFEVNADGTREYHSDKSVGTSFLRYGVSKKYTSGISIQFDNRFKLFGIENSLLYPIGTVETNVSGSKLDDESGFASKLIFRTHEQLEGRTLPFHSRTILEHRSQQFRQYAQLVEGIRFSVAQFFGARITANSSAGVSATFRDNYLAGNDTEYRADYRHSFLREYNAGVSTSQRYYGGRESEFRIAFNLSWHPHSSRKSVVASYDSFDRNRRVSMRGSGESLGLRSNYIADVGKKISGQYVELEGQLSGPRGELGTHYSLLKNDQNDSLHQLNLDTRFSLAFADSSFAFGKAINNSFAIVKTSPGVSETSIPIMIGSSPTDSAITNFGPALVSRVSPYQYRELSFDKSELSEKYLLEQEHFAIFPGNKRGVLVETNLSITTSVLSRIVDSTGRPLSYLAGDLIDESKNVVARFFSNRKGRIYLEHVSHGDYILKLDDDRYSSVHLKVLHSEDGITRHPKLKFSKREF